MTKSAYYPLVCFFFQFRFIFFAAGFFFPGNPQNYSAFIAKEPAAPRNSSIYDLYQSRVDEGCAAANPSKEYLCGPANVAFLFPYITVGQWSGAVKHVWFYRVLQVREKHTKERKSQREVVLPQGFISRRVVEESNNIQTSKKTNKEKKQKEKTNKKTLKDLHHFHLDRLCNFHYLEILGWHLTQAEQKHHACGAFPENDWSMQTIDIWQAVHPGNLFHLVISSLSCRYSSSPRHLSTSQRIVLTPTRYSPKCAVRER